MGQIAVIERQPAAPVPSFTLSDLEHIAGTIARGGMFGSKDPYAVLTLCMLAQAEGQHPAVVFRDYDIIQGKPAKKAKAMQADFLAAGGTIKWLRLDDECAEATFSHPAGGEATINWTMARAHKAGLGAKEMWKKYPRQMLRSRTVSEGVSTVFPGATSGLYVPEEIMDFDDGPAARTPPTPQPMRARDMKQIEAPAADPARAKAEQWLTAYLADPADTPANKRALAKLQAEHPDLYERAIDTPQPSDAGQGEDAGPIPKEPIAEAAPQQGNDLLAKMKRVAAGTAHQPEGRDESEMGETPTLDQAKAALDGCKSEDAVQTMLDSFRGQLSDEDLVAASIHANAIVAERWAL